MKTQISTLFSVSKLFHPSFEECSVARHPFLSHLSPIYGPFMFSKGVTISQMTTENIVQSPYFRPNMDLSSGPNLQPSGMRIHVFTTSDSKEVYFGTIVSMVVESSHLDDIKGNTIRTLGFLVNLFHNSFDNLKILKFSGFWAHGSLRKSLSTLKLDWLYWIYSSSHHSRDDCFFDDGIKDDFSSLSNLKRLHLELEEGFNLHYFPKLPSSLEELSLHLSNLENRDFSVIVYDCITLKKM